MSSPPSAGNEYFASPLNAVFGNGPNDKALKQAFYNTAALIFVVLSGTIAVIVYYVLEAFIRPLLWAALCGTFLHPFQKTATSMVRSWLSSLHETNTPLAVGFALLPLKLVNDSSELFGQLLRKNVKIIIAVSILFPVFYYLVVCQPFLQILLICEKLIKYTGRTLEIFQQPLLVWTLVAGYVLIVVFWWSPSSSNIITKFSIPVWMILFIHLASYAGKWKVLIFFILLVLLIFGLVEEWNEKHAKEKAPESREESPDGVPVEEQSVLHNLLLRALSIVGITTLPAVDSADLNSSSESIKESQTSISTADINAELDSVFKQPKRSKLSAEISESSLTPSKVKSKTCILEETGESFETDGARKESSKAAKEPLNKPNRKRPKTQSRRQRQSTRKRIGKSDPYFIFLFWAFLISRLWCHMWILQIVPVLALVYIIKKVVIWFQVSQFLSRKCASMICYCEQWTAKRKDAIVPIPVRGIYKLMLKGDKKVIKWTDSSVEKLISVFMILCLIVFATLATIFLAIQVQQESAYMARLVSSAVNETVAANPELLRWLPENTDVQKALDSMVHRAYIYGRQWMVVKLNVLLRGHHRNSSELENHMTSFVDNLYEQWLSRHNASTIVKRASGSANSSDGSKNASFSLESLQKWFPSTFEMSTLLSIVKENVDTLKALVESVWSILKSNVNLAFTIVTTVLSMIFFSSTYVLNTGLSSIVFLTALFYLLSTSGSQYKVVEWVSGVSMGTRFSESVDFAVRDVFGATLKMAAFYGFYTWMTHSLFGINIVFIPSVLAASLAAIPFIGTYFAAIPGALELWLVHDHDILAVLLIVLHMLPTYVVDIAIYSEISGGGHPYLTGLAVAGGMYWFGLEGAIVGPIVLCCLVAAFNVYNKIFTEDNRDVTMEYGGIRHTDYTIQRAPFYRKIRRAMSEER